MGKRRHRSQVIFLTGAASGIGAATAKQLIQQGDVVTLADINVEGAKSIAAELGERAHVAGLDITSSAAWDRALDATIERFGRLDVLINNAAIVITGNARDVSVDQHRRTHETNFIGPLTGILAALRRFSVQGHGHIVTICSMTSFVPSPGIASYGASKQALRAFHHAIALEERHQPIDFTIVHPTATETPMLEQEERDDSCGFAFVAEPVTADAVAATIVAAIRKKSIEVCMPPEQARTIQRLGTDARQLRKMYDQIEMVGKEAQKVRREKHRADSRA
jgi:NAD(P)-dependent dehydrogenase (short-subunit alcohol dehydrogenase family)